jgi:hypothetical protein
MLEDSPSEVYLQLLYQERTALLPDQKQIFPLVQLLPSLSMQSFSAYFVRTTGALMNHCIAPFRI